MLGTEAWRRLRKKLYRTKWVSYAKPPFAGPESVYQYLGRYTHRVGLSDQRLVSATADTVTFRTWGEQTASLHPHEFLRRFLQHVLPDGFVKLRHYGLARAAVAPDRHRPHPVSEVRWRHQLSPARTGALEGQLLSLAHLAPIADVAERPGPCRTRACLASPDTLIGISAPLIDPRATHCPAGRGPRCRALAGLGAH